MMNLNLEHNRSSSAPVQCGRTFCLGSGGRWQEFISGLNKKKVKTEIIFVWVVDVKFVWEKMTWISSLKIFESINQKKSIESIDQTENQGRCDTNLILQHVLQLDQGGLTLTSREQYLNKVFSLYYYSL